MAIRFHVPLGTVVLCDFSTGFRPPEMVKKRPVVVVSRQLAHRDDLCTVVPLGQSGPLKEVQYQCLIALDRELPYPFAYRSFWAKADMLATVSLGRLDLFRTERDQTGKRKYIQPKVGPDNLRNIRSCILHALALEGLTIHLP